MARREIVEIDGVKHTICSNCGELKPITDFFKCSQSPDGVDYYCKKCRAEHTAQYRNGNGTDRVSQKLGPSDKPLCKCTPRELMAELKARGFVWDKMWTKTYVEYSKI